MKIIRPSSRVSPFCSNGYFWLKCKICKRRVLALSQGSNTTIPNLCCSVWMIETGGSITLCA